MKTAILLVSGDDYSAMDFEREYNPQSYYEKMVAEGVKRKQITELDATVQRFEFDAVDPQFIQFVRDYIQDYDMAKSKNFYAVNPVAEATE